MTKAERESNLKDYMIAFNGNRSKLSQMIETTLYALGAAFSVFGYIVLR